MASKTTTSKAPRSRAKKSTAKKAPRSRASKSPRKAKSGEDAPPKVRAEKPPRPFPGTFFSEDEKRRRAEYRITALAGPRDSWVARIEEPRMSALARAVPAVCELLGVATDVLRVERKDQSPASMNENAMRMLAIGALVDIGQALGLSWNEMHCDPKAGRSDVLDMPPHAGTIRQADARWKAYASAKGQVPELIHRAFPHIKAAALSRGAK